MNEEELLTKKIKSTDEKEVWFCGCDKEPSGTVGFGWWGEKEGHEKKFNYDEHRMEYICHLKGKISVKSYFVKFISNNE